ncbi:hypothetical protein [Bacillus sonorensis]|nr:hypothetical protein [Bacillus sonorensis]
MYETDNAADRISVKIDVDVSDAITGLKAVQREAKAATKALAEFQDLAERLGEKPLADGWETARSLRSIFDRLDEEPTVYLVGKEIRRRSADER